MTLPYRRQKFFLTAHLTAPKLEITPPGGIWGKGVQGNQPLISFFRR